MVDFRGSHNHGGGLAKWSIGCLDLATVSCRQTLRPDSLRALSGVIATAHLHQLNELLWNVEAFVLAADCERGEACVPRCGRSRVSESTQVQPL